MPRRHLWLASAAGAAGGGINAALCYFRLPVPVEDSAATFQWHVIPAGAAHGGILAVAAVALGLTARRLGWPARIASGVAGGWLAGYLSWIPLHLSTLGESLIEAPLWPFRNGLQAAWIPYAHFGAVVTLLSLWLAGSAPFRRAAPQVAAACLAGALGSLWWWISWGPWYFAVIHGVLWGLPTGLVAARAIDLERASK